MAATAIVCFVLSWGLLYVVHKVRGSKPGKLPPGPPADPILGHLRVFPQTDQGQKFYEWSKQYGDVIHLDILGRSIIILNSQLAASDLLDKRSAKYSDRPEFPGFNLLGWDNMLVFLRYGPDFHKQRRFFQQALTRQGCLVYRPIQLEQTHILLRNLLERPDDFRAHIHRFASAITVEMIYGRKIVSHDDAFLRVADEVNVTSTEISKAVILDLFPSLKHLPEWFPGAWFIRYAKEKRSVKQELEDVPFEEIRKQMSVGTSKPCFVSMHLEELEQEGKPSADDLRELKIAAGHMWTGGSDTTWSTLLIIILALVRNPEPVKKAQEEIDRIIGHDRLPTFDDFEDLPYVRYVIYEAMRWHSAIPLGIPHRAMEDDIYRDMFIPKDSTIIVNTMAIALDENVYKDPHKFWPERYLPENGSEPSPTGEVFGFGRRICPGRHLAEASLWIVAANLLACFDIEAIKDERGQAIIPDAIFTDALTSHPAPFKCLIRPRSKQAESLIEQL